MVPKPFYNEAGFEGEDVGGGYVNESALYSERAFVMARGFVRFAMTMPPVGLEDVLAWLYLPTLDNSTDVDERGLVKTVIKRADKLIRKSEQLRKDTDGDSDRKMVDGEGDAGDETRVFLRPLSRGAVVMLRRQLEELKEWSGAVGSRWRGRTG